MSFTMRSTEFNQQVPRESQVARGLRSVALLLALLTSHVAAAQSLKSLTITPKSVVGGSNATGTVSLSGAAPNGGLKVTLSTSSSAASPPPSVTVPSGGTSAQFTLKTVAVPANVSATITGSTNHGTATASLEILAPTISGLTFTPPTVYGTQSSTGKVTLSSSAPAGGLNIALSSSSSTVGVPSKVTVASGSSSATFQATTSNVTAPIKATISATLNAVATKVTLTVDPIGVASLSTAYPSVANGTLSLGTVMLTTAAPPGGLTVTLSSSKAFVSVPASLAIPSGLSSATFTITARSVIAASNATITASLNGGSAKATISVLTGWPTYHADTQNTGFGGGPSGTNPHIAWEASGLDPASEVFSGSAVIDTSGDIYIGSNIGINNGYVYAFTSAGNSLGGGWPWNGGRAYNYPALNGQGSLYVVACNGTNFLYSFPTASESNWTWRIPAGPDGWVISPPVIGPDGTVFFEEYNLGNPSAGGVFAAYPQSGNIKWSAGLNGGIRGGAPPAIGPDGTLYCCSIDGSLFALNPSSGATKWSFATNGQLYGCPSVGNDGTVYVGSTDHNIYALNSTGNRKWAYSTNAQVNTTAAIGPNGLIYVGSLDGNLYALNSQGGLAWKFTTGADIVQSATVGSDGTIYCGSNDHNLYAITPSGKQLWKLTFPDAIGSVPVIGPDGSIYVAVDDILYRVEQSSPPSDPSDLRLRR